MRPNRPLEEMLKEALDELDTAVILAEDADRVRTAAIQRLNQCRRVATMIREAIIERDKVTQ